MQAASGDDTSATTDAKAANGKNGPPKKANDPTAKDDAADSACQPIVLPKDAAASTTDSAKLVAAKDADTDKDAAKTDKDSPRHRDGDYAQAHLDGATPPVAVPPVPVPQQAAAATATAPSQKDTAVAAAAAAAMDDETDVPATDIAASSMQAKGTTAKPTKPGDAKPAPDSSKAQARGSAASALADVSKAASRTFADQKTVAAPPSTAHLDGAKPTGTNGTTATQPQPATTQAGQTNPNTGQTAQTQQTQAAVQPAAAHTPAPQQPVQAPVGNAIAAAAQQTGATPTSGAATQLSAQLQISHPPATSTADTASLAFTIASRTQDGAKHFDIRLDPAELGRIDVHMTVDDAGKAQAALSVEKPQTLELLQKDSSHLERALKESGLDLSQNGLSFSLKGQQQQGGNNSGGNANSSSRGRALAARAIAAVDNAASNISLGQMSSTDTRLDIRV